MTITDQSTLFLATAGGNQVLVSKVASATAAAGGTWFHYFHAGNIPIAGTTPTAGTGALRQFDSRGAIPVNPTTAQNYLVGMEVVASTAPCTILIADLLWHNSGMSGTNTAAQAVNSLTITRDPGRMQIAFMEIFTLLGTTSTTISVNYTDSEAAAQVGTIRYSGNPRMGVRQVAFMEAPAGAGDGVATIQSATLAATTGTAGNFGLGIMSPIAMVHIPSPEVVHQFDWSHLGEAFVTNSCLTIFATAAPVATSVTAASCTAPALNMNLKFANG